MMVIFGGLLYFSQEFQSIILGLGIFTTPCAVAAIRQISK